MSFITWQRVNKGRRSNTLIILGTEQVEWAFLNLSTEFPRNTEIFLHIFLFPFFATTWNFPNNATNISFKALHLVFDAHIIQMAMWELFFNAHKIDCFIFIESKYPNSYYNNYLIPLDLLLITFPFTKILPKYVKLLGLFSL